METHGDVAAGLLEEQVLEPDLLGFGGVARSSGSPNTSGESGRAVSQMTAAPSLSLFVRSLVSGRWSASSSTPSEEAAAVLTAQL